MEKILIWFEKKNRHIYMFVYTTIDNNEMNTVEIIQKLGR